MQSRTEIIDSMISHLQEVGEDHNDFFKGIDVSSLDEFQLETCSKLIKKVFAKPEINYTAPLSIGYACRNADGDYYRAPGYEFSSYCWYPAVGQARIYHSVANARRACKRFQIFYDDLHKKHKTTYRHLKDVEVVAISMVDNGSVPESQDKLIKKNRKEAAVALANARVAARTPAKKVI